MMTLSLLKVRPLTLFVFSLVLLVTGCASINLLEKTPVCFSPGSVAKAKCFYNLEVTEIISDSVVRAKVPYSVLVHNAKHSSYTALGGLIGSSVNTDHYGDAVYEFAVENPKSIRLKPQHVYEFRGIKGKASLEVIGDSRYPEDQGEGQGKDPDQISTNIETGLYARHSPQCCMCGTCQSGCVCPGQGNCLWCAAADVKTLLASVSIDKDTVDVRSTRSLKRSSEDSSGSAGRFLTLMSGSRAHGNIFMKFIANYTYDQKFAPTCLTKRM